MKFIIPLATSMLFAQSAFAQEPEELGKLRELYLNAVNRAVAPISKTYIEELGLLKSKLSAKGEAQQAALVDNELKMIHLLNDKGLQLTADNEVALTDIGESKAHLLDKIQGLWSRVSRSSTYEAFEFKSPDKMIRTVKSPTDGGGVRENTYNYKVEETDQKIKVVQENVSNPDYRHWYEIDLPLSEERMTIKYFYTMPGSSTKESYDIVRNPFMLSASFWQHDVLAAICDGLEPKNSTDFTVPRQTWFPVKGTLEWVQLDFEGPRKVSETKVYWFDDTATGHCRVPKSARVLYKAGNEWKPVVSQRELGVSKDKWNRLKFEEVETTALRLEAQLQEDFSAGVLEWKID